MAFCEYISYLTSGINVFNDNSWVVPDTLIEPVEVNTVCPSNVPQIRAATLNKDLQHRFVVLQN